MRIWNLPVNAELLESVMPIDDTPWSMDMYTEITMFINHIHSHLEIEYMVKTTGALPSAVMGRGAPYRVGDMG